MANPSLKAQIEAAKSALASDLAAPSLVAPSAQTANSANHRKHAMILQLTLAQLRQLHSGNCRQSHSG